MTSVPSTTRWVLDAEAAMTALGEALGQAIAAQTGSCGALVITLDGELGAGKTTLVRGALRALGVSGAVRSPTYTLIEPYAIAGRELYHLDLYRLASADEVEMLALRDLLTPMAVLWIEWAERGRGTLPLADLGLEIDYVAGASGREVRLTAHTPAGAALVAAVVAAQPQ